MTKDDKKIVRNVILFCILFSVFFTVYRVSSLLEKKYEDANQQDNNTAVSADKSIENNSTPKGYDNITGVNILPKDNYTPAVNYAPVMQENIYTSNDNNSNVINSLSDLNKDDKSIANPYDDLDNMLYDAAVKGDFESVRRYIDMGANINSVDSSGSTIIYRMSLLKNLSMDQMNCLNYLLLKGADANKENYNGYTPLTAHFSSNLFNKEFLDRLLQNNAEINSPDFDGDTPLHFAVMNNNLEAVEYLLENGANTNVKNKDGITPLHIAVKEKNYDITGRLLSAGADRNTKDIDGISALDIVKAGNDVDLFKLFSITQEDIKKDKLLAELQQAVINNISKPAVKAIKENVDKGFYNRPVKQDKGASSLDGKFVGENPTPLIAALYFGYNDIAKALINIGADINKPNDYPFYSPLMVAAESGNKEMVNLLLDKGADVNYQSKMDGITALNVTTNAEIADIILKAKADPNMAANASCLSALQMAVINNNYDLAEVLLKYGADANHVDCKDYKPVIANAIDTGNPAIVRLLLNYNAGVNTEVGEDLSVKVIDYANQKGNKMIIDMINEKLQQSMPKKQEVIEKDNASSLIKNNVNMDNKKPAGSSVKDNISKDNKSDNVLIKENTETKMNKNDNNSSNEIDDIMNNIVNGL